jgi:hypothetical protein
MYWVRSFFGVAGIFAVLVMFYDGPRGSVRGSDMLSMLSGVTMLLALCCGALLTADCISSEKREDTLGFLFLTNLKGYDVVAGKISIHAVTTACGLLSVFPVFFLPLLAGGVSWAETLRVLLAIAVSFVFALTLGVWISARSRDARNAVMVTLTALILIVTLPLLWLAILEEIFRVRRPSLIGLPQLSPGMLLYYARDFSYYSPATKAVYWSSIGFFVTASAILASLASGYLPRAWRQDEVKPRPDSTSGSGRRWWRFKKPAAIRRRFQFLSANPMRDLLANRFSAFAWGRRLRNAVALFFVAMLLFSFGDGDDEAFVLAIATVFGLHLISKFVFAFDATRALHEDKRSSALELLMITPLGERAIADAHSAAFRFQFKGTVRRLLAFTIALQVTALMNDRLHLRGDDLFLISSMFWGAMIWTLSDYHSMPWLGLQQALKQSSHLKATLHTLGRALLVPWSPYFVVILGMAESRASEEAAGLATFAWAIGSAIFQKIRTKARRSRIIRDFRRLAAGG